MLNSRGGMTSSRAHTHTYVKVNDIPSIQFQGVSASKHCVMAVVQFVFLPTFSSVLLTVNGENFVLLHHTNLFMVVIFCQGVNEDMCIRSDSSLDVRVLPTVMAKDYLVCVVCSHLMLCNLCYSSYQFLVFTL